MKPLRKYAILLVFALCASCADMACMEQYNPRGFWAELKEEEARANKPQPTLTKDGKLKTEL